MTFTYAGDYSTDLAKVRFHIHDVVSGTGPLPGGTNFTDEEIGPVVTAQGSWTKAVAVMLDTLATSWAAFADTQVGPRHEAFSQVAERYESLAKKWRDDNGITTTGTSTVGSRTVTRKDGYSDDLTNVET